MQKLIGVYETRAEAEQAIRQLISRGIQQDSITLLTREKDSEAVEDGKGMGKLAGGFAGGALGAGAGATLGMAAATMLVPGIGPVIAVGVGAAALLGLGGSVAGAAVGQGIEGSLDHNIADENSDADKTFYYSKLNEGRSVLVANVDSQEQAQLVNSILEQHSLRRAS